MFSNLREGPSSGPASRAKPSHPGPSINLAVGAALVGVIVALILFFVYRPAPAITFGMVLVLGLGAVMLALGASLIRQWLRDR